MSVLLLRRRRRGLGANRRIRVLLDAAQVAALRPGRDVCVIRVGCCSLETAGDTDHR